MLWSARDGCPCGIPHRTASSLLAGVGSKVSSRAPVSCARLPGVKIPTRLTAVLAAFGTTLVALLGVAPPALADNGVGLAGPTTDKTITFFCFGVIAFFAILVIVLSIVQGKLEKRKERRRYDLERYG
jgi:hypothetical protein